VTSSNVELIDLTNSINCLTLLLKTREKNEACPYIKELLEISLFMERIESVSLNKIVEYQAGYSSEKLREIKAFYREVGDRKVLHFKMARISAMLSQACW
jgi:hypothetical protein